MHAGMYLQSLCSFDNVVLYFIQCYGGAQCVFMFRHLKVLLLAKVNGPLRQKRKGTKKKEEQANKFNIIYILRIILLIIIYTKIDSLCVCVCVCVCVKITFI